MIILVRFKPVEVREFLTEDFNALHFGPKCIDESKSVNPNQSEDCLHLNIYTPKESLEDYLNKKVPVLVYIHGGQFEYGNWVYVYSYESSFLSAVSFSLNPIKRK